RLNGEIYADFLRNELPVLLADVPLYVRAQMIYQHDGEGCEELRWQKEGSKKKRKRRRIPVVGESLPCHFVSPPYEISTDTLFPIRASR
ncbi:hypothetical protein ALC62_09292, partial [Cyphomyrmex costatus]